jgi:hypothetical protein
MDYNRFHLSVNPDRNPDALSARPLIYPYAGPNPDWRGRITSGCRHKSGKYRN